MLNTFWRPFMVAMVAAALLTAGNVSAVDYVSPTTWYFSLYPETAQKINDLFQKRNIKVSAGLYFTNQREASLIPGLRGGLMDESTLQLKPEEGGGSISIGFEGAFPTQNLWLLRPGVGRYLLGKFVQADPNDASKVRFEANRFMANPRYYISVRDGVVAYADDWILYRRHRSVNPTTGKMKSATINVRAFTQTFDQTTSNQFASRPPDRQNSNESEVPIFVHSPYMNKMLAAVWPKLPANNTTAAAPSLVDLVLVDLADDRAKPMLKGLTWPFYLTNDGVYYAAGGVLAFRRFDWRSETFGTPKTVRLFNHSTDRLEVGEDSCILVQPNPQGKELKYVLSPSGELYQYEGQSDRFARVTDKDDKALEELQAEDILAALRQGEMEPLYGINEISKKLSQILGGAKKTWAILLYEDGQMPEEAAATFAWEASVGLTPVADSLAKIERVYHIKADHAFEPNPQDPNELQGHLDALHDVLTGKRDWTILQDFPTRLVEEAKGGAGSKTVQTFWKTFRDCLTDGTCRVVMTMKKSVYKELLDQLPDIMGEAQVIPMPDIDKSQLGGITKISIAKHERQYAVKITDDAVRQLMLFAENFGHKTKSPGNEDNLLTELFDWTKANFPGAITIEASVTRQFIDHKRGVDVIANKLDIEGLRKFLKMKMIGHEDVIDTICDQLLPIQNGTVFGTQPLAFFTLIGTPGVGKTYLAKLIAEYLTGRNSLMLMDMKTFKGFDKNHPVYQAIKSSPDKMRIVLFDDVDQADQGTQALLAGVVEEGFYAQGSEDELNFNNTIVFFTANWGQELIKKKDRSTDTSIMTQLRRDLGTPDANGVTKIHPRVWSRIESSILIMYPFSDEQLLHLTFTLVHEHTENLKETKGVELIVDPRVLIKIAVSEKEAQAGARSLRERLDREVFLAYQKAIRNVSVKKIVLIQNKDKIRALTDLDGANFNTAWTYVDQLLKQPLEDLVKQFGGNL